MMRVEFIKYTKIMRQLEEQKKLFMKNIEVKNLMLEMTELNYH